MTQEVITSALEDTVKWLPAGFFILNDLIIGRLDTVYNHVTDIRMVLCFMNLNTTVLDPTDEMDAVTIVCDKAVEELSRINDTTYSYEFVMINTDEIKKIYHVDDAVFWSVHIFSSEV